MKWFKIDLTERPQQEMLRLCRAFQRAFIKAGAPQDMALFAAGKGASERYLYLTPGAHPVLQLFASEAMLLPCAPPSPEEVTLLYGAPEADNLLRETRQPIFGDGISLETPEILISTPVLLEGVRTQPYVPA